MRPGDVFKTVTGDIWYVDRVSSSGAYCIHLSAHPTPITTRKKVTKIVRRHLRNAVFSLDSQVDLVDQSRLDPLQLRRRLIMGRKESTVAETATQEAPAETAAAKVRVTQKYSRTDKAPEKELRGQAKETFDAISTMTEPATAAEVAAKCVYAGSRQEKERVAAFYLAAFKKKGLVAVTAAS